VAKIVTICLILVVLIGGVVFGYLHVYGHDEQDFRFRTVAVERSDLSATIGATGTIEPEEVIDIGAQVAGMIQEFGRDPQNPNNPIDYGSRVEKGTVLARIDESLYRAAVDQAAANLHQAEANVHQAAANLDAMKSKLEQTRRDWQRVQKLEPTRAISATDVDTARNAFETASATVPAGEAALEAAKKSVEVSRATLATAKINLNYCTIVSPVKGVIVDRRVNIGQTVVSSLSAPSLFLLAKDLTRLQVWCSVNEADIGQIRPGQPASFRVSAFPGERFRGTVVQIRLNATMTQNVVTYTVVVGADNRDGRLLPYMTANVDFEVGRRIGVLRVPNMALRWHPAPEQIAPEFRAENAVSLQGTSDANVNNSPKRSDPDEGRVWVPDGPFVHPIKVRVGLSDGLATEIVSGELQERTPVVVGEMDIAAKPDSSNPFAPKLPAKK
jgi:HlyD family secretion protein